MISLLKRWKIVFLLILLLYPEVNFAQQVALVLSGGGARGLSHIGVIKALEENQIPIDYIAGTSMGAIVGAMYASGYTTEEMERIFTSSNVQNWASGLIDDKYMFYFKENPPDASLISIPIQYNSRIISGLQTTMVTPYEMDFLFMESFGPASAKAGYDFDSLFVPFRCVAADIDSNKVRVFNEGNLCEAVRASMTYPFYFRPISVGDKLYFDGGMYNNFPVDVAIEDFDPEVIIGSKAAGNYDAPQQDDLLSQIQNILMANTDYSLRDKKGLVVVPDLKKVGILDFSHARAMIDSGYVYALKMMDEIKALVPRRISGGELSKKRMSFLNEEPPIIIDSLYIQGLVEQQTRYVNKILMRKKHYININEFRKEYFKLVADDKFEYVYPKLHFNRHTGFYDVRLDVRRARDFVAKFGGNISSSAVNEAFVGLQFNYLGKLAITLSTNAYFGRFYSSFRFNGRIDYATRTPFFLDLDLIYNHRDYFRNTTYFFQDKDPSFIIRNNLQSTVSLGFPATNKGKIVGGVGYKATTDEYYQTNTFTRLDTADQTSQDAFITFLTYELNSLNRKQYASSGARFKTTMSYVAGTEVNTPGSTSAESKTTGNEKYEHTHNYFSLRLLWENYFKSFRWLKLGFYSELYISNQEFYNNYTASLLAAHAFEPVPESRTLFLPAYRAYNYGAVGLINIIPVYKKVDVRIEGYLMQPYRSIVQDLETKKAVFNDRFADRYLMGSMALIYHSPIGPLSISLNYYDRLHDKFSFILNFGYLIFNRSIFE